LGRVLAENAHPSFAVMVPENERPSDLEAEERMRVWGRRILLAVVAMLAVAQFIPVARTNPPV
jgi:hypothetical protein